jgi:hypothetical protein
MCDFVKREDVINILETTPVRVTGVHLGKLILPQYENKCRSAFVDGVKNMESVKDIEYVRHACWVDCGKTEKGSSIIMCSRCNKKRAGVAKSPYCRDCGAKMDYEEDDIFVKLI